MKAISRTIVGLYIGLLFSAPALSSDFSLDGCTSADLNQTCNLQNAQQQLNCLSNQVGKIQACNRRVAAYEVELKALVKNKVEEKGLAIVDPLKQAKANHLEKLKEFENIMKWHDANVKSTSQEYVRFVKEFQNAYKNTEKQTEEKFKSLFGTISGVKNYLDLINTRFDVRSLQRDEDSQAHRFITLSTRLIGELQAIEGFVKNKMSEYSAYLDKNSLASKIPNFVQEIDFARSVAKYAQARMAVVGGEADRIVQNIDANMAQMEKAKLQRDKDIDFKDSRFIAREKSFLSDVNRLVDDALLKSDPSKFAHYEFLGARYNGLDRLLTLDSVCSPENLRSPQNDWLVWGCEKYGQMREFARNRKTTQLPLMIKAALSSMELERPHFAIDKRKAIVKSLESGKIENAVAAYDQLLNDFAQDKR